MGKTEKIETKAGLQFRMTMFVVIAVLAVLAVTLPVMAGRIRADYEEMLDSRISDDLAAITKNIEQRMLRMEDATETMVNISSAMVGNLRDIDSVLYYTAYSIDDVLGVSIIFREGYLRGVDGYCERYAHFDENGNISLGSYSYSGNPDSEFYWQTCYDSGNSVWSEPTTGRISGKRIVCYVTPFYDDRGERIGIAYSWVPLSYLTSFVTNYKLRRDIDISVYNEKGAVIMAPDDYILELAPEDLLTWEAGIEHLGWKVVLSADREIINGEVRPKLISMTLLILLMAVVMAVVIRYAVRHVARPFVQRQHRIEKEKAVMDNEMHLAAAAQKELIPHKFPPFPDRKGIELSACLHPARDVGGDLYDYFINEDKLYFCIGDVSGKGVQASLFMAATHYLFRSVAAGMPAADAVRQINAALCEGNESCRFVTFWFGCLDLGSGSLEYVNAGHDSPVFLRNGEVDTLPRSENMPLGVMEDAEIVSGAICLAPEDMMLLYTDGVTEAMDAEGHEFGKQRLDEAIEASSGAGAADLVDGILARIGEFVSGAPQSDDITMLCLKFIRTEIKS
mgnify:FL=1